MPREGAKTLVVLVRCCSDREQKNYSFRWTEARANALIDLRSRDPATRNGPKQYPFTIELRLEERDWGIVNTS